MRFRHIMYAELCAVTFAFASASTLHAFNILDCSFNFGDNPEACINGAATIGRDSRYHI